jgi:hypothetical protein
VPKPKLKDGKLSAVDRKLFDCLSLIYHKIFTAKIYKKTTNI